MTTALAQAQPLDFSSVSFPGATGARDAVVLDVNRDGWPDLATANTGRNTVAILENRADGQRFGPPREIAVGAGPFDIDAGDLNRDGIPDLIVTTPDGGAIEVLLMAGNGQGGVEVPRGTRQPGVGSDAVRRHARRHSRLDLHRLRARSRRAAARHRRRRFRGRSRRMGRGCKASGRRRP